MAMCTKSYVAKAAVKAETAEVGLPLSEGIGFSR